MSHDRHNVLHDDKEAINRVVSPYFAKTHLAVKRLAGEIDAAEIAPRNTSILDGPIIVILSVIFGVLVMLQYDNSETGISAEQV